MPDKPTTPTATAHPAARPNGPEDEDHIPRNSEPSEPRRTAPVTPSGGAR